MQHEGPADWQMEQPKVNQPEFDRNARIQALDINDGGLEVPNQNSNAEQMLSLAKANNLRVRLRIIERDDANARQADN